jgi:hypothetical protein
MSGREGKAMVIQEGVGGGGGESAICGHSARDQGCGNLGSRTLKRPKRAMVGRLVRS